MVEERERASGGESPPPGLRILLAAGTEAAVGVAPILDALPYATLAVAHDRGVWSWNGAAAELLGWSKSEVLGRSLLRLLPPDARDHVDAHLTRALAGERIVDLEAQGLHEQGHAVSVLLSASPLRAPSGEIVGVLASARANSGRRLAAAALARSEATFRSVVESCPVAMVVHRMGTIVYANPTFLSFLGYETIDEVVGRSLFDGFLHPDDHERVRARMEAVQRMKGALPPTDLRMFRRNGSICTLEATGIRIDYDGASANLVIARDTSEQRDLQARLMVSDRMASIGTLAAGVAHEINNPLAAVAANLELIGDGLRAPTFDSTQLPELREIALEARQSAERIRKIVRGMKTLSRVDDDRREALDVRNVVELALGMVSNEIRHRARVVKDLGRVPLVEADEGRLVQILINLLVNAAHAIPLGQATRNEIAIVTRTDEEGRAVVEIRDTGCGIAPENLGKIFDPFFTTKAVGEGTGLGLPICLGIASSLGGTLSVTSELGTGTAFWLTLPCARTSEQIRTARPPTTHPAAAPTPVARVLVVDDDPALLLVVKRVLGAHEVTTCDGARAALDRLTKGSAFDVILCDLMMPEMTGADFYEELRKQAPHYLTRVVFVTGGAFAGALATFLEEVPNERLEKPFDLHALRALVRRYKASSSGVQS